MNFKKTALNNVSNKDTKISKEKLCYNDIIAKALIYTPPKAKKQYLNGC